MKKISHKIGPASPSNIEAKTINILGCVLFIIVYF